MAGKKPSEVINDLKKIIRDIWKTPRFPIIFAASSLQTYQERLREWPNEALATSQLETNFHEKRCQIHLDRSRDR